jgi:invasion protein IalB
MNSFQKYFAAGLLAVLVLGFVAFSSFADEAKKDAGKKAPDNQVVERGWTQRCPEKKPDQKSETKQCEIFQRIDMKESSMRVAEFAVGFPQEKGMEKGAARGVVVLPLGILLEEGVQMKIDDGKPVSFKTRFCTNAGCFSFVMLGKDVLETMKKAKAVTFLFKTSEGQNVNLIMTMGGFEKALKDIQP